MAQDPRDAEQVLVVQQTHQLLLRVNVVLAQLLLVEVQVFECLLVLLEVAALLALVE